MSLKASPALALAGIAFLAVGATTLALMGALTPSQDDAQDGAIESALPAPGFMVQPSPPSATPPLALPSPRNAPNPPPDWQNPWSLFHPAWNDVEEEHEKKLGYFVSDPESRLEADLSISPAARKRVLFWVTVYLLHDSQTRVLHDRNVPGVIFGYLDLKPVYQSVPPSRTLERRLRRVERAVRLELKQRLREAMGLAPRNLCDETEINQIRDWLAAHEINNPGQLGMSLQALRSQSGQSDMFQQALDRSRDLLPKMETIFRLNGLPVGLSQIPFVESSFNKRATSKVGARGIWQFTSRSARAFIDRNRHNWSDPLWQTWAAARMLKRNRVVLPDWGTTVISYNSGVGRLQRLVRRSDVRTVDDLMVPSEDGLGFAGKNYYAELLAINLINAYRAELSSPGLFDPTPATGGEGELLACD